MANLGEPPDPEDLKDVATPGKFAGPHDLGRRLADMLGLGPDVTEINLRLACDEHYATLTATHLVRDEWGCVIDAELRRYRLVRDEDGPEAPAKDA